MSVRSCMPVWHQSLSESVTVSKCDNDKLRGAPKKMTNKFPVSTFAEGGLAIDINICRYPLLRIDFKMPSSSQ